jgi:outer membrane protein assembly factor BamD
MDDVLLGLGDSYAAQARAVGMMRLAEGPRTRLVKIYNDQAAAAYGRLVTVYPVTAHAEIAKDKLTALGYPVPTPTEGQLAASQALENSRTPYTLTRRAKLLVMHTPDTVSAARVGEPTMADPPIVSAPQIVHQDIADLKGVMDPNNKGTGPVPGGTGYVDSAAPAPTDGNADTTSSEPTTVNEAQPALEDVHTGEGTVSGASSVNSVPVATGTGLGVDVVKGQATGSTTFPGQPSANTALPPVEKAADAPETVNDAAGSKQAAPDGSKPAYDKSTESSNKHKKKSGLDKLNPF